MAKVTMATVKSFIRKNQGKILISTKSRFDGMYDSVMPCENSEFRLASPDSHSATMGIAGAWFVGGGRDYITPFEKNDLKGFEIYNSCGCFEIAVKV